MLSWGMGQVLAGGSLCQNGLILFWRRSCRYSRPFCMTAAPPFKPVPRHRLRYAPPSKGQNNLASKRQLPSPCSWQQCTIRRCELSRIRIGAQVAFAQGCKKSSAGQEQKQHTSLATSHWIRRRSAAALWRRRRLNSSRPMLSPPPASAEQPLSPLPVHGRCSLSTRQRCDSERAHSIVFHIVMGLAAGATSKSSSVQRTGA